MNISLQILLIFVDVTISAKFKDLDQNSVKKKNSQFTDVIIKIKSHLFHEWKFGRAVRARVIQNSFLVDVVRLLSSTYVLFILPFFLQYIQRIAYLASIFDLRTFQSLDNALTISAMEAK